jgi:hypothetical protein
LEEVTEEYDIPQDGWDILDKAIPYEEPTSGNPAFITEEPPPPEEDDEGQRTSPSPAPDTSSTGLFSSRSTTSPPVPSSLIMGAPPCPDPPANHRTGFKPRIEVVDSSESAQKKNSEKCNLPIIDPTHIPAKLTPISESTGSTAKKSSVSSSRESSKLAWSGIRDKPPAAPESTELESGGQWAVTTSASN